MTDATTSPDGEPHDGEPSADIDLDAIEADLNRVERALGDLAEGTYFADSDTTDRPAHTAATESA
ncbi:MAG: hypothetical protein QNM02_12135 [Acidimicrobiia bacterium]|nr:hypothetical protein [Acidimicrobiia bacterium]